MAKVRRYTAMPLGVLISQAFACAITSPTSGATVTQGTPVAITGTISGAAVVVQVKLGSTVLGSASIVGLNWSYSWTPQVGDVGAQTINAVATSASAATATANGVPVTVASTGSAIAAILGTEPAWWLDGNAGRFTDVGSGVCSQWADSTANARNFTFASGQRPTIQATGLNSKPTLKFATGQFGGNAGYAMPAPGTTLSYFFAIARLVTTVTGPIDFISLGTSPGTGNIYCDSSGHLTSFNSGAGGQSAVITANTWYRLECLLSNTATDYVDANGAHISLFNAGNAASTGGVYINGSGAGVQTGTWEYAEVLQWTGAVAPTTGMRTSLAAYSLAKWGI